VHASSGPVPATRDVVVLASATACLLAAVQALPGVAARSTASGVAAYAVALGTVLVVRQVGPGAPRGPGEQRWRGCLAAAAGVLAAWALVTFASALPEAVGRPHSYYVVKQAVSTPVGDHNTAAGPLLVGAVAAAGLAAEDRRWRPVLALVAAGLVVTLSRGAALVLVVVALLAVPLASAAGLRRWLAGTAVAVVAGVLAASVLLDASPPAGAADPAGPLGASVVGRVDLAVRGAELTFDHPWVGVGIGSFGAHAEDLPPPNDHAHQLLAHAGAEGGLLLVVVALAVPLALARRGWRHPPGQLRDLVLLGGLALVLHAQLEILGGRVAYEPVLAVLAALVTPRVRSASLHDLQGHR
jgi:hypothetical protein